MTLSRRHLFLAATAVVASLAVSPSSAEAAQAKAERYEVSRTGSSIRAGAARIVVPAGPDVVRRVVTDYRNYGKLSSHFQKARVVGKKGEATDVYLQVPILKGAAKVWVVLRFEPVRTEDGVEIVEARMVKGNVKRMEATWRFRPLEDGTTELRLEMLIDPGLPVPGALISKEAARAADISVTGASRRAEARVAQR